MKSNIDKNSKDINKELLKFISGYASSISPQTIDEIQGDFQLAGLGPLLNSLLSRDPTPKIIDFGCGNGVILQELYDMDTFKNYPTLEYIGFDFPDKLSGAFATANKLMILPKVRLFQTDESWLEHIEDPCIIIIRNVFHELKIGQAAKLLHQICMNLPNNSFIILQDMTTLPIAEKGQAGWFGQHIAKALEEGGINVKLTNDTSKHGINVFIIEGSRQSGCEVDEEKILSILSTSRKEQLDILCSEYEAIKQKVGNELHLLRLNHDIAAIILDLRTLGLKLHEITEKYEGQTLAEIFRLAFSTLSEQDIDVLSREFQHPEIKWFQNRSHSLKAIEEFLRSDKSIFFLMGGPFIGKRTSVLEILSRKPHKRYPIFVNLEDGSDLIKILEDLAVQLKLSRFIDVEVLLSLDKFPTDELKKVLSVAIKHIIPKAILILDGFENIIDPEGRIIQDDIIWLIDFWSKQHGSKIIIESRRSAHEEFMNKCAIETLATFKSRPNGEYGEYLYTVQLLQDIVPFKYRISDSEFGGFPVELLKVLDNHPHFTYIAGTLISNSLDSNCLVDSDFLSALNNRLYMTLISNFNLTKDEEELIYALSLIQVEFPLKFVDMASGNPNITKKLIEKGLIIESLPGLFRTLGILQPRGKYISPERWAKIEQKWHPLFEDIFNRLYKGTSNPSFIRQAYYHATLSGRKHELVVYYLPQVSTLAETWYRLQKYDDALWAYNNIKKVRKISPKEQMRMASCLVRLKYIKKGEELYNDLLTRYKTWYGVRSSFIDSLIFVGGYAKKALGLLLKIPVENRKYYWHRQAAKCYRQLHDRSKAYKEYEDAIIEAPFDRVWSVIHEFVIYARELGDTEKEKEWLEDYTWDKLKLRFDEVKLELGAFYERIGELEKAESFIRDPYRRNKSNAYYILPLIKTLCRLNKLKEVERILNDTPANVSPKVVFIYTKVIYLKTIGNYKECELLLNDSLRESKYPIHSWGQWADLFLSWCQTLEGEKKISTAKRGLKFVEEIMKAHNVPALMACFQLAKIVGDSDLQKALKDTILRVNESYKFDEG